MNEYINLRMYKCENKSVNNKCKNEWGNRFNKLINMKIIKWGNKTKYILNTQINELIYFINSLMKNTIN